MSFPCYVLFSLNLVVINDNESQTKVSHAVLNWAGLQGGNTILGYHGISFGFIIMFFFFHSQIDLKKYKSHWIKTKL